MASSIVITLCFFFFSSASAHLFYVGGDGVWIPNPMESYQTWSGKTRFQIHDTIYFKYPKGSDSVQQVMKADFDGCNTLNPLQIYTNGETVIELDQSGPFYFISGNKKHCKKGQKVIITVLSPRTPPAHSPAAHSPAAHSPAAHSPAAHPTASPPTKSEPPKSSSIAPATPPTKAEPPKSSSPDAPKESPATPPAPAEAPKGENVTAPAPSPKSSASGVTVISVMTTLSTVAFTLFMFV